METNRLKLYNFVTGKMSQQERKDWIYEHTDKVIIINIISDMSESDVENELNSVK